MHKTDVEGARKCPNSWDVIYELSLSFTLIIIPVFKIFSQYGSLLVEQFGTFSFVIVVL